MYWLYYVFLSLSSPFGRVKMIQFTDLGVILDRKIDKYSINMQNKSSLLQSISVNKFYKIKVYFIKVKVIVDWIFQWY